MLHKEVITPATLGLLKQLQSKDYLKGFYLVGGTALALQWGHRISVDLDLFSDFSFDTVQILENISNDFDFKLFFTAGNTIKGSIDNVQIDILAHRYPRVSKPLEDEGVSMLSDKEIIAMKLNAIAGSGQRVKDFIDIYFLLKKYTLAEMLHFYKTKYKPYNEAIVLKSIVYFEDVELAEWPVLLKEPGLKWEKVTKTLTSVTKEYLRNAGLMR